MAEKARLFGDEEVLEKILRSKTPAEAKKWGRAVKNFDQPRWESVCYSIVKLGNWQIWPASGNKGLPDQYPQSNFGGSKSGRYDLGNWVGQGPTGSVPC